MTVNLVLRVTEILLWEISEVLLCISFERNIIQGNQKNPENQGTHFVSIYKIYYCGKGFSFLTSLTGRQCSKDLEM